MEAEIKMTQPQAKGHRAPPGAGSGAGDGLSPEPPGGTSPANPMTLDFRPSDLQENGFLLS